MTEAEWLACDRPAAMVGVLREALPPSTLNGRLLAWVKACRTTTSPKRQVPTWGFDLNVEADRKQVVKIWAEQVGPAGHTDRPELSFAVRASLLREVAGYPFSPTRLFWFTRQVQELSEAALADRQPGQELDPVDLLLLADALEEAGCTEERLLRHLRGEEPCPDCVSSGANQPGWKWTGIMPALHERCGRCKHTGWIPLRGPHVAGCWAVDLILGKE